MREKARREFLYGLTTSARGFMTRGVCFCCLVVLASVISPAGAVDLDRPIDAVVVKGSAFPLFDGVSLSELHLYKFDGTSYVAIPFQIDENKRWNLVDNLRTPNYCPVLDIPDTADICETNLATTGDGGVGNDPIVGLDFNDELLFMARDAGTVRAPHGTYLATSTVAEFYEIVVRDTRKSGSTVTHHGRSWVYLYRIPSQARQYSRHYVEWESLASDPSCRTGDVNQTRGKKACGWAHANIGSTGFSHHAGIDLRWIGNQTIDGMRTKDASSGAMNNHVLDRYKLRVKPEEGEVGVQEDEESWDTVGCPRFVGLKEYDSATKQGALSVHRMVQGNESGFATTRNDRYYGTHLETRIRLRVHSGVPPLRVFPDFLDPDGDPWKVYTRGYLPGSGGEELDTVDGAGLPAGKDPALETDRRKWNWHLYDLGSQGKVLFAVSERRPLRWSDGRDHYYDDKGSSSLAEPDEDDGSYGNAGIKWLGESLNMQDLVCLFPESEDHLYREVELRMIAVDPSRSYTEYLSWLSAPLTQNINLRSTAEMPLPTPVDPCQPQLVIQYDATGYSADVSASTNCPGDTTGYLLYRSLGLGSYTYLGQIGTGGSLVDPTVEPGVS